MIKEEPKQKGFSLQIKIINNAISMSCTITSIAEACKVIDLIRTNSETLYDELIKVDNSDIEE